MRFFNRESKGLDYIIVGLGNPGPKYENTRHNVGFCAIDEIAKECRVKLVKIKHHALVEKAVISGKKCLLVKPLTYMNLSGDAVEEILQYYKLSVENLIVIFDDISLDVGQIRIKRKGTHGGHNGIKDIILKTGSSDFARIKIGVGQKPHPDYNLADFVLSSFKKDEQQKMDKAYLSCYEIVSYIINGNIDKAMNLYN